MTPTHPTEGVDCSPQAVEKLARAVLDKDCAALLRALSSRLSELERDAARYRWLRGETTDKQREDVLLRCLSPHGMDAAIDAALARGGKT